MDCDGEYLRIIGHDWRMYEGLLEGMKPYY